MELSSIKMCLKTCNFVTTNITASKVLNIHITYEMNTYTLSIHKSNSWYWKLWKIHLWLIIADCLIKYTPDNIWLSDVKVILAYTEKIEWYNWYILIVKGKFIGLQLESPEWSLVNASLIVSDVVKLHIN